MEGLLSTTAMSSMRPPMLAGPIERQVKFLRIGSADLCTGSAGGAGCWKPCASMPRAPIAHTPSASRENRRFIAPLLFLEVDLRDGRGRRRRLEVGILLEAEHLGGDVAGEAPCRGVVFLDALVVAHARDRQPVLG